MTAFETALSREVATDRSRRLAHQMDVIRTSGVTWAGMGDDRPFVDRTDAEREEAARANATRMDLFRLSPEGRFLAAVVELGKHGSEESAERLRSCYSRGLPGRPAEIGRALAILELETGPFAKDARRALIEMLIGANSSMKAA